MDGLNLIQIATFDKKFRQKDTQRKKVIQIFFYKIIALYAEIR